MIYIFQSDLYVVYTNLKKNWSRVNHKIYEWIPKFLYTLCWSIVSTWLIDTFFNGISKQTAWKEQFIYILFNKLSELYYFTYKRTKIKIA